MRSHHVPLALLMGCLVWLAHPMQAISQAPGGGGARILPEVDIQGAPVEEVVDFLQSKDPSLQILVARDPGVPSDRPLITIKLKNVGVMDVLKVLPVAYSNIELVPANDSPILVLKVHAFPGDAGAAGQVVRVYGLHAAVESLSDANGSTAARGLEDVLSLVKAALDQTPQDPAPVIQLHTPTMALIVKATNSQQETVAAAIQALTPPAPTTKPAGR
jgi:hypothetical protein